MGISPDTKNIKVGSTTYNIAKRRRSGLPALMERSREVTGIEAAPLTSRLGRKGARECERTP